MVLWKESVGKKRMCLRRALGWGRALSALGLLVSSSPALAATITVGGSCALPDAIRAANADAIVGGCAAGVGTDTIVLPESATFTLTAPDNDFMGGTGLPVVTSTITVEGHHARIVRDAQAEPFRIFAVDYASLTLVDTIVTGGWVEGEGGAILSFGSDLTLERCTIDGNSATDRGGGVAAQWSEVVLSESTVSGNTAGSHGGGIAGPASGLQVSRSAVFDNSAGALGGGLYFWTFGREALIVDSTISGNEAGEGGGIVTLCESVMRLQQSTVTGNVADIGGGLSAPCGYTVSLSRSIISGNEAPVGREANLPYNPASADDFNLFGHDGDAGVVGLILGSTDLVPSQSLSAILSPALRSNGGATLTHLLASSSPARDAGPIDGNCTAFDQRGVARPEGTGCDLGAVELVVDPCQDVVASSGCTVNGAPNQLCSGTSGNDVIVGTAGADIILGRAGNDLILGGGGADVLCGGGGADDLRGQAGADALFGGIGSDTLTGGLGADALDGGAEADSCARDRSDVSVVSCN